MRQGSFALLPCLCSAKQPLRGTTEPDVADVRVVRVEGTIVLLRHELCQTQSDSQCPHAVLLSCAIFLSLSSQVLTQSVSILSFLQRSSPLQHPFALGDLLLRVEQYAGSFTDDSAQVSSSPAAAAADAATAGS